MASAHLFFSCFFQSAQVCRDSFRVQKPRRFGTAFASSSHCWVKTLWEGRERRRHKQTDVSNRLGWRLVHRKRWWLEIGGKFLTRLLFLRRASPVSQSGPERVVSCHPLASALNSGTAKWLHAQWSAFCSASDDHCIWDYTISRTLFSERGGISTGQGGSLKSILMSSKQRQQMEWAEFEPILQSASVIMKNTYELEGELTDW